MDGITILTLQVINNNLVTKGSKTYPANTLWVLEQIPGHVVAADQTSVLNSQGYWPSYNIPFYPEIYNLSGRSQDDGHWDW